MNKKDAYIWFSGATDVTGKVLKEKLGIDGGTKSPPKGKKLVIGWGTKTKDVVRLDSPNILNHPDKIRSNRNKLTTLKVLKKAKIPVAEFVESDKIMAVLNTANHLVLPIVGRTKYHQGGKGFWTCLTKSHVKNAIGEGAQYFQEYIDIKDEYRIHVFGGKVIYAVKKVKRTNIEKAYVDQREEKIRHYAGKKDLALDKKTLDFALERIAKENNNVDMVIRSNKRGWKFSRVTTLDKAMEKAAIDSVKSAGLDFGAVDCCLDINGKPWIIEINSGPSLAGTTLDTYSKVFESTIKDILTPKKTVMKKVAEKVTAVKNAAVGSSRKGSKLDSNSAKDRLAGIAEMLDIVQAADEEEAAVIERLLKRKLGA